MIYRSQVLEALRNEDCHSHILFFVWLFILHRYNKWRKTSNLELQQFHAMIARNVMNLSQLSQFHFSSIFIKIRSKLFTPLCRSDDILLRVISDWPLNEPVRSLLPKFGPVANGAKRKVTFDVTYVTLCKHSETLAPFFCLGVSKCSEIVRI